MKLYQNLIDIEAYFSNAQVLHICTVLGVNINEAHCSVYLIENRDAGILHQYDLSSARMPHREITGIEFRVFVGKEIGTVIEYEIKDRTAMAWRFPYADIGYLLIRN